MTNLFEIHCLKEMKHAAIKFLCSWHIIKFAATSRMLDPQLRNEMKPHGFAILNKSAFPTKGYGMLSKNVRASRSNKLLSISASKALATFNLLLKNVSLSRRKFWNKAL